MPDFSIFAVTTAQNSDEAEVDGLVADFDDASEAKGYARRQAEETHGLAAQLDLDFDYSHVSVFEGDVEPEAATQEAAGFIGMWLFADEGVEWASAATLREAQSADETSAAAS